MMSMWLSSVMFFLFTFFSFNRMTSLVVGSESAVSRQDRVIFPSSDSDNEMRGFASFENGILLLDPSTSVDYNSAFALSGNLSLNGGRVHLLQDMDIENDFLIATGGVIDGDFFSMNFPAVTTDVEMPVSGAKLFTMLDTESVGDDVFSIDWNAEGDYLAAGIDSHGGQELKLLYFDGQMLTVTLSVEIGRDVEAVRWHPSLPYLAYAKDNGGPLTNEVSIRYFDISNGTLGETGGVSTARSTRALAWHPSGNFLLTGEQSNASTDEIRIYMFSAGSITPLDSINLSPNRNVSFNALSFSPGGNFFAVGTQISSGSTSLLVYNFDGSVLALDAEENVGRGIFSVDWHPTGTYIAVGLQNGPERLRVYKHDSAVSSITEAMTARVGESARVNTVHWDKSGNYLLSGTRNGASSKLDIYFFDTESETLTKVKEFTYGNEVNDARWSPDNCFVATGDDDNDVTVYSTKNNEFIFKNVRLNFNSNVLVKDTWKFFGESCIQLNGNKLIFDSQSKIIVSSNSSLELKDLCLSGLQEGSVLCLDDSSTLTLNNTCALLEHDFTFSNGSIHFLHDVTISGTGSFYFTSNNIGFIAPLSQLRLTDGLTFYYLPSLADKELIQYADSSSQLFLDTCTLVSSGNGLRLFNGSLVIQNSVTFSNEALSFAEGFEFDSTLNMILDSNSVVDIHGYLRLLD